MKADEVEADLESPAWANEISSTWMYDWMQDLKDFDTWKKSVVDDDDLSHVFAFRESKIYTVKRIRQRLHRIQTTMVLTLLIFLNVIDITYA
jgi:hypothetical protein